jgi:hypothetical protein
MTIRRRWMGMAIIGMICGAATEAAAVTLAGFGRCLKSNGATFYGAAWCGHCRAQRETLGDAMEYVRYVECSVDREDGPARACRTADVDSYPTWTFADGSRAGGAQSLAALAAKTGCTLPRETR